MERSSTCLLCPVEGSAARRGRRGCLLLSVVQAQGRLRLVSVEVNAVLKATDCCVKAMCSGGP